MQAWSRPRRGLPYFSTRCAALCLNSDTRKGGGCEEVTEHTGSAGQTDNGGDCGFWAAYSTERQWRESPTLSYEGRNVGNGGGGRVRHTAGHDRKHGEHAEWRCCSGVRTASSGIR